MAKGPRYRRSFRRRSEGRTDYHKRAKLIKSRKLRVVIRVSNNHVRVQIVQSKLGGDKVLISAFSKELTSKYGWNASSGNLPASYLTGYLAGIRAKNNDIKEAIFDLGIFYHTNRVLAACKGVLDAGIQIPYHEEFFPVVLEERIKGNHIENYAKILKSEDSEKYEKIFSGYLNKKVDPLKMSKIFSDSQKIIENKA
ncbi:MAG: 50S ribosomal protein L18 [Promethearchaeota archaeon]|jgi:large subunit ribosomal protein L18